MKHISKLKDLGEHRKALLIGNGHSVNTFDFTQIDVKDTFIFGMNYIQQPIVVDYLIYYDEPKKEQLEEFSHKGEIDIIGLEQNECNYTDYYYKNDDIVFCDTGNHLLQLVSNIMKFEIIYLIGYDYYTDSMKLRYYNNLEVTKNEYNLYDRTIFHRALHRYYKPYCKCSDQTLNNIGRDDKGMFTCKCEEKDIFRCKHIFNLNPNSMLKKFSYKNIKEEVCQTK